MTPTHFASSYIPLGRLNILQVKRCGAVEWHWGGCVSPLTLSWLTRTQSLSVTFVDLSIFLGPMELFSSWLFTWYDSRLLVYADIVCFVVCCMQMLSIYSVRLCLHMLIFTITILLNSKVIEAYSLLASK